MHLRAEAHSSVLAAVLRLIQRDVGVAQQLCRGWSITDRDTDTGGQLQGGRLRPCDIERFAQHLENTLRDELNGRVGHPFEQRDELVSADSGEGVAVAQRAAKSNGDSLQQPVADFVAECVVDVLESVQVDEECRDRSIVPPSSLEQLVGSIDDQRAVG